jgi:hypothetical protein
VNPTEGGFYWARYKNVGGLDWDEVVRLQVGEGVGGFIVYRTGDSELYMMEQFQDWQGPLSPTKAKP